MYYLFKKDVTLSLWLCPASLQEYVRLVGSWCQVNVGSYRFVLGHCYLASGEGQKVRRFLNDQWYVLFFQPMGSLCKEMLKFGLNNCKTSH